MPVAGFVIGAMSILGCGTAFRKYVAGTSCQSQVLLHGKTVIVTGCNTGIGKETARDLAKRGARVILACRDLQKAQAAKEDIAYDASCPSNLVVHHLDLGSLASVRSFAKKILETETRLDMLINNAGVFGGKKRQFTEDGFEIQFGVNHLGHFLLTNLLLDLLKASAPSKIVNVSSEAHDWVDRIHFDDLMAETWYDSFTVYGQSKLANILFTNELAKRLNGTRVYVYSVHPGTIFTQMIRSVEAIQYPCVKSVAELWGRLLLKTPKDGAQTTLHCAVAKELEGLSGRYFSECQVAQPAKAAQDHEAARKLWDVSMELVASGASMSP